jgi:hypothetical protein
MNDMSQTAAAGPPGSGPQPRPLARMEGARHRGGRHLAVAVACLLVGQGALALAGGAGEPPPPRGASQPSRQLLLSRADRALQAQRWAEAAELYRRAATLDPAAGDAPLMAAVAAFQLEDYRQVRRDLARAFARQLSPEDRALGHTYLELVDDAPGQGGDDARPAFTPAVRTTLGAGFDDNPQHRGATALESEATGGLRGGAGFGSAALELGLEGPAVPGVDVEFGYALEQTAYSDRALADLDYQDHLLELTVGGAASQSVRVQLMLSGDLSLSGVGAGLTPFSRGGRSELRIGLGGGELQLQLGASYQGTEVLDPDLAFLSGHRFEVTATPVLVLGGWRAALTARLRTDALGSARFEASTDGDPACATCAAAAVVPYSNRAAAVGVRLTAPGSWRLRPALWARGDRRLYQQRAAMERTDDVIAGSSERTALGERATGSTAAGASLRLRLGDQVALTARWEYQRFVGVFRPASPTACAGHDACNQAPLTDRRYHKQTLGLQLEVEWL